MRISFCHVFCLCVMSVIVAHSEDVSNTGTTPEKTESESKYEMKQATEMSRENLIVEDKVKAAEHLQNGISLYSQKKYKEALDEFKLAKVLDLSDPRPNYYMGKIFADNDETDKAMENYLSSIKRDPNYIDAHLELAAIYMSASMWDDALAEYDTILKLDPMKAEAHFSRGVVLNSLNKDKEAIAEFEEALKLKPNYSRANYNIGVILYRNNLKKEALKEFQNAVASDQTNHEAYKYIGLIYVEQYITQLKAIKKLEETNSASKSTLEKKLSDNQKVKELGVENLKKSLAIFPTQPDLKRVIEQLETQ